MAGPGLEVIAGARRDPVFGPVVLLGLGGTVAEALGDVTLRGAPLSIGEAAQMPGELLGRVLLAGWRGGPVADPLALAAVLVALGQIVAEHPQLEEIEINPLRVTNDGVVALDAVVIGRSEHEQPDQ